ncbi:expressed unknown protein [Seminavis robusta]|uniref:Uncharacterized protein n=1 Tax=Seminavis robusta TaxID=568900 RepID=A0A9N8DPH3_9STRA|nr:expressed unknown protein [Seminavis robusta]|eukprot:Sro168_g074850.1 n/a (77) ;mRNA; f:56951-57263
MEQRQTPLLLLFNKSNQSSHHHLATIGEFKVWSTHMHARCCILIDSEMVDDCCEMAPILLRQTPFPVMSWHVIVIE